MGYLSPPTFFLFSVSFGKTYCSIPTLFLFNWFFLLEFYGFFSYWFSSRYIHYYIFLLIVFCLVLVWDAMLMHLSLFRGTLLAYFRFRFAYLVGCVLVPSKNSPTTYEINYSMPWPPFHFLLLSLLVGFEK